MTKKTEIPELETFRALDARLAELVEKQTAIDAELKAAQDACKAAREARAAISDCIGSKELRDARKQEQAALERIAELEADAEDADTAIDRLRREVIGAEAKARVALMKFWRGQQEAVTAELTEKLQELQPLVCSAYWSAVGSVPGVYMTPRDFLANAIAPALGLHNTDAVFSARPDIPTAPPQSVLINDVHRSLLRDELRRQDTENTLPPAA